MTTISLPSRATAASLHAHAMLAEAVPGSG
jgi:hypothetical protein